MQRHQRRGWQAETAGPPPPASQSGGMLKPMAKVALLKVALFKQFYDGNSFPLVIAALLYFNYISNPSL